MKEKLGQLMENTVTTLYLDMLTIRHYQRKTFYYTRKYLFFKKGTIKINKIIVLGFTYIDRGLL